MTDPEVTRYFMTVGEAVQLVIQAGAIGSNGEALVLDMGKPVRIDDMARQLVDQAPETIKIVYTGLRQGEKLHEDLLGDGEIDVRPRHPLISQVHVPALGIDEVSSTLAMGDRGGRSGKPPGGERSDKRSLPATAFTGLPPPPAASDQRLGLYPMAPHLMSD